ncbi:MAG: molybdopterin-dependent oxidoreductase, partial [Myxococcales bacterium]
MERREFIKMSAMAAATALLEGQGRAQLKVLDDRAGLTWNKAPCRFCGTGCHVQVGVEDGRVVAIAGDRKAPVNQGLLCVKGYHVGLALYGKDRLTRPLLRKNGELTPISWEEALDVVAERIAAAPDRFAIYGSGQWTIPEGYACQKLMKGGLGNNHIDPNARLCMASAVTGFVSTYGVDEPASCYDDLDAADVIIVWGNNPAEMHPVLFSRFIDRRSRGEQVTLIDIGTRRTRTTSFAQHYLEFRPHTDLAIANGIAHLLVSRGQHDRKFVERHCNFRQEGSEPSLKGEAMDFDAYVQALSEYTPERVQ